MALLTTDLKQKIDQDPSEKHQVIIRVNTDVDSSVQKLQARGFQIRRTLRLIKGIAATGTGAAVVALSHEPWVTHIEEDQQVHTM